VRATILLGSVGLGFVVGCGDSAAARDRVVLTPQAGDFHDAAYSPDGTRLAFTADRWDGGRGLWISATDGSGAKAVSSLVSLLEDPRWSPDGSQIAYWSDAAAPVDIWVVPAAGGEARQVTSAPGIEVEHRWSPDGKRIMYATNRRGNYDILAVPIEGGVPDTISAGEANEFGLCESCGEEVGIKRLEARPVAELCIDCKSEQERLERRMG